MVPSQIRCVVGIDVAKQFHVVVRAGSAQRRCAAACDPD